MGQNVGSAEDNGKNIAAPVYLLSQPGIFYKS